MSKFFEDIKNSNNTYIIAEIGINHNGDMDKAFYLIDKAKECGADAVKFQTFKTELLISLNQEKMPYQVDKSKERNQFDMLKKVELDKDQHKELIGHCNSLAIDFISTPYDIHSAELLIDLGVKVLKVASTDTTNLSLIRSLRDFNVPLIISTGVTSLDEIDKIMSIFSENDLQRIAMLHCVSNYPAPLDELNLRCIATFKQRYKCLTGFSDHSDSLDVGAFAVCAGARILEKHFTFDKNADGPDHLASVDLDELSKYIKKVRDVEIILGDGFKRIMPSEEKIKLHMQKSIVAKEDLNKGKVIEDSDLWTIRPATGISALNIDYVIGKKLTKDKRKFEQILNEDIEDA